MFVIGTLFAAIASGGAYLVNFLAFVGLESKNKKPWDITANIFNVVVIAIVIYSYYRFYIGIELAYIAFSE